MNRKTIWKRLHEWDPINSRSGPGKFFDRSTYRGCFRALILGILILLFLWHFDSIFARLQDIRGVSYEINLAKQSWARVWAVVIGGGFILATIGYIILIPINRRRAEERAKGQWYDRADLTSEDLHSDPAEHERQDHAQKQ